MAKIYSYAIQEPKVTSNFGWRDCPYHGREFHNGVDLISGTGNRNLYAIEEGYVHIVNYSSGYGNYIWIRYPRINKSVMYAHCEKVYAKKGDNVLKAKKSFKKALDSQTAKNSYLKIRNKVLNEPDTREKKYTSLSSV